MGLKASQVAKESPRDVRKLAPDGTPGRDDNRTPAATARRTADTIRKPCKRWPSLQGVIAGASGIVMLIRQSHSLILVIYQK